MKRSEHDCLQGIKKSWTKSLHGNNIAWRSIQFQTLNLFFENSIYHPNIKPYSPNLDP